MAASSGNSAIDLTLPVATPHTVPDLHADAQAEVLELFDTCRDGVFRYALSFGLTPADAEDVLQEVFLALFRHLAHAGARTNLKGWVFRVTRNLGLRRRAGVSRLAKRIVVQDALRDRIDPGQNPEERLLAHQRQARLRAVVGALPDRDRQCLCLRAEGLRYREIATTLEISLGTVASTLARAIARVDRADRGARAVNGR